MVYHSRSQKLAHWTTPFICFFCGHALAQENTSSTAATWRYSIAMEANYWGANGSIINSTTSSETVTQSFYATDESLDLPRIVSPYIALQAHYKRWTFGVDYLDINYPTTQGYGQASAEVDSAGGFVNIPLTSNINLNMLLGRMSYRFVDVENSLLSVGVGLGMVDILFIAELLEEVTFKYKEDTPFATVDILMENRVDRFTYGFAVSASYADFEGISESYLDYKLIFGYQLAPYLDVTAGFRHADIAFNIEYTRSEILADISFRGPYLGLKFLLE